MILKWRLFIVRKISYIDDKYDILWKEKHIRHYHVNDYGGGYMEWSRLKTLPPGKGHFDFDKFFDYIRKNG